MEEMVVSDSTLPFFYIHSIHTHAVPFAQTVN